MNDDEQIAKVLRWAIIENIVIILVVAVLFYLTRSAWVFLFLLLINNIKTKQKIGG